MARLFIDGFEAGHLQAWKTIGTGGTIVSAQAGPPNFRSSGYAYHQTSGYLTYQFTHRTDMYASFRWYASSGNNVSQSLIKFATYAQLSTDASGNLILQKYDASTVDTGVDLDDEREYRIGLKIIGKYWADGALGVYVNGVEVYSETDVLTMPSSIGFNQITLNSTEYYDDVIFDDSEMPGDTHIAGLYPNADGDYENMTASGAGDHYADVDDTTPSVTDYWGTIQNGRIASVNVGAITGDARQIKSVQVNTFGIIDGTASMVDGARPVIVTHDEFYRGDNTDLPTASTGKPMPWHVWSKNPYTGKNWTIAEVTSLQIGAQSELDGGIGTTDDLYMWLAADSIEGVSNGADFGGSGVGPWIDWSGNGLSADRSSSSSLRPSYHTGVQNSLPALRFDGTESLRIYFYTRPLDPTDMTAIFVCDPDSAATAYDYLLDIPGTTPATDRLIFCAGTDDAGRIGLYDGSWRNVGAASTGWQIITFVCSEENGVTLYIDGAAQDTISEFVRRPTGGIGTIGLNYTSDGGGFAGDIGEVALFSRALTSTELGTIHTALGTKWGIVV